MTRFHFVKRCARGDEFDDYQTCPVCSENLDDARVAKISKRALCAGKA